MKKAIVAFQSLDRLFRRDGFAVLGKCFRYAFSKEAWHGLVHGRLGLLRPSEEGDGGESSEATLPNPYEWYVLKDYHPFVSIVVTSYNYAHLIRETLDSLLAQTYRNFEILVIDNGSTDGSPDVIREYEKRDSRVRLLQHPGCVNKGLPASVRLGVDESKGEFVAFCEADDLWTVDHLEKKIAFIARYAGKPNVIINEVEFFGDKKLVHEMESLWKTYLPVLSKDRNRITPVQFREHNWIFTFSCCMVRRGTLTQCDMNPLFRAANMDWWLWRQIGFDNEVWCVHERLTKWRLHGQSYMVRDKTVENMCSLFDQRAAMDRLLVSNHSANAESLFPFLRPEDDFTCENGALLLAGSRVEQPRFSIVIPIQDSEKGTYSSLESLANQSYQNFEVVLVGSEDDLLIVSESPLGKTFSNRVVKVSSMDKNISVKLATGVRKAKGEWVIGLLPGDEMRALALQTFAARSFLNAKVSSFYALAMGKDSQMGIGGLCNIGKNMVVPCSCIGAFAVRNGLPGLDAASYFASFSEPLAVSQKPFDTAPVFIEHYVLIHKDSGW